MNFLINSAATKEEIYCRLAIMYSFSKRRIECLHSIFWSYFYHSVFIHEDDFYNFINDWQTNHPNWSFQRFMNYEVNA